MNPLVSIITPCFNGEKYLSSFLDSIVNQTYDNIELIFVDDGSTDNTKKLVDSYANQLNEKGYCFKYFYQENKGQAAAINCGLKVFSGDYLMWTDADDILLPENVGKKVDFLKNNPDCGMVQSEAVVVEDKNVEFVISTLKRNKSAEDNLFIDLLNESNVIFVPGIYMVTRKAFEESIPSFQIFESREGQNWQLLLPISFKFKCGYIEEPLLKVVSHDDSHSRVERTLDQQISRFEGFIELLSATINSLDIEASEKKAYIKHIKKRFSKRIIHLIANSSRKDRFFCLGSFIKSYAYLASKFSLGKPEIKALVKYVLKR